MKRIIVNLLVMLALVFMPVVVFGGQAAAACPTATDAKTQVLKGVNETGSDCSDTGVTNAFSVAVEVLSFIAGAVAVIMIIYSGFRYITSAGDASKVGAAKTTLIYALVGIVVVALSQLLIRFVIHHVKP